MDDSFQAWHEFDYFIAPFTEIQKHANLYVPILILFHVMVAGMSGGSLRDWLLVEVVLQLPIWYFGS